MKKKLLSVAIAFSMVCGLCACGGNSGEKAAIIIIEDETYNLSGDFQDVVGSMVENDLQVMSTLSNGFDAHCYDDEGKIYKNENFDREEPFIYAIEKCVVPQEDDELGFFVQKMFWIDTNAGFESKLGFDSDSEKKDIKEVDGFMKCTPIRNMKNDAYVAMFVNGKAVDFSEYEEAFEEWKDILDEDGYTEAYEEFFDEKNYPKTVCRIFSTDMARMCNTYDELETRMENYGIVLKEEMLLAFSMQEACELLEDEDIENVVVIRVELDEDDGAIMEYDEFYYDKDWDDDKFKK